MNNLPKVPLRLSLPSKPPTDLPSALAYIWRLSEALQQQTSLTASILNSLTGADVLANRPPAAQAGRMYYATDNSHLYVDNGTSWVTVV